MDTFVPQEIGYTFNVQGTPKNYFGTLCLASADNLGSCALGGFKEGSTAYRGCRHCIFSVASGALVPDVMHDVLEGVLQYEVKLLLRHLIYDEHCFTLDQLNSRISRMELGYMESSNRPSEISAATLQSQDNNLLTQNGKNYYGLTIISLQQHDSRILDTCVVILDF